MIAEAVSHYRIIRKLGAGGMGEVYLPEDTSLRRKVALKLLSGEYTRNEDALRRFVHEAQAASALNHPNIGKEAAAEFQRILDHRGVDPTSLLYPLSQLGLARGAALTGDTARSRKAYEDLFALWKEADSDLPVLQGKPDENTKTQMNLCLIRFS